MRKQSLKESLLYKSVINKISLSSVKTMDSIYLKIEHIILNIRRHPIEPRLSDLSAALAAHIGANYDVTETFVPNISVEVIQKELKKSIDELATACVEINSTEAKQILRLVNQFRDTDVNMGWPTPDTNTPSPPQL